MEASGFSTTVHLYQTAWRCISEDGICCSSRREFLKPHTEIFVFPYHFRASVLLRYAIDDETFKTRLLTPVHPYSATLKK
jgi:hypothetical protein